MGAGSSNRDICSTAIGRVLVSPTGASYQQLTHEMLNKSETARFKSLLKHALIDLRVSTPAIVTAFDPVKQVVTVQIAISELVRKLKGPVWTAIPPIYNVPIVLPRAGGFCLTLPIAVGDEGLLVFCDQCIDLWWQEGGQQPPPSPPPPKPPTPLIQPNFERRRHDLTDCGFIPGMWNQKRVLTNYSTNSMQLRSDDGTAYIEIAAGGVINIKGSQIILDSTGNDTEIDGRVFLTHKHSGVTTGGGNTGNVV